MASPKNPGSPVWQPTNIVRGDVLAFDAFASRCVALMDVGGRYRVLYSCDDGGSWSMPWPDLPGDLLVTAIFASSDALFVGVLMKGVVRAAYPRDGAVSHWEDASADLPTGAVVTCMARWKGVILAGTRGHGIFARPAEGWRADRWRADRWRADGWKAIGTSERRSDAMGSVAALIVVGGRLVGLGTRGVCLVEEEEGGILLDPHAPGAPIGVGAMAGGGLITWGPRSVRFTQHIGAAWLGLPEPPPEAFIRSVAGAGSYIVSVMQGTAGAALRSWRYSAHDWMPICDGLPPRARPSVVHATATGVLVGMADHGIYRLPLDSDERLLPNGTLILDDGPTLQTGSTIRFTVQQSENLQIQLYGPDGECIRDFSLERFPAGTHQVTLVDASISPGVYMYTIRTQGVTYAGRRVVLR